MPHGKPQTDNLDSYIDSYKLPGKTLFQSDHNLYTKNNKFFMLSIYIDDMISMITHTICNKNCFFFFFFCFRISRFIMLLLCSGGHWNVTRSHRLSGLSGGRRFGIAQFNRRTILYGAREGPGGTRETYSHSSIDNLLIDCHILFQYIIFGNQFKRLFLRNIFFR